MLEEPVSELLDGRNIIRASVLISFGPTNNLPLHVTLRRSQVAESGSFVIDLVYLGKVLDKRLRQSAHEFAGEIDVSRWLGAQYDSLHTLHDVERRAEYLLVIAKEKRARDFLIDRIEMRKNAVLATHVVRRFDFGADRRTAQDELPIAGAQ